MKHFILSVLLLSSLSVFGQETWNACNSTVNVIPQPSYDSTFVLSAPSRAALAKGMANWTPATSSGASYLVYTALLTQTGTDAPVATVLENTLGGTVVWSYISTGTYNATLSSAFTSGKTVVFGTIYTVSGDAPSLRSIMTNETTSTCTLYSFDTGTLADDILATGTFIEIRVYN